MSDNNQKENLLTKFLKAIHEYYIFSFVFLFVLSIIIFGALYFCHSKNIENRFDNTLQNYEKSMSDIFNNIITNGINENIYTNSFQTNNNQLQNDSIDKLKLSFEVGFKMLESAMNEIMKNSNDILQFWFAFLSVIMVIFTLAGALINNNILNQAREQLRMVENEAKNSIEKIKIEAKIETNKLIEENNKSIRLTNLFNLSTQAYNNKEYNLSINYLNEIIKVYEDDFNNKKYDEKSDSYDKAIKNCAVAYNNRGNIKYELRKYKEAIEDYNKAIENYNKAMENYNKDTKHYNKAMEFNTNYPQSCYNRGIAKYNLAISQKNNIERYNKLVKEVYNDFETAYNFANEELKNDLINKMVGLTKANNEVAIKFCEENDIDYKN